MEKNSHRISTDAANERRGVCEGGDTAEATTQAEGSLILQFKGPSKLLVPDRPADHHPSTANKDTLLVEERRVCDTKDPSVSVNYL